MNIPFFKYQGTGNDFIIIDAREDDSSSLNVELMCHRRFGIGADGLMLLKNREGYDFEMVYFNSDGRISSMCGNGGRCIAAFAHRLGLGNSGRLHFLAVDGPHEAHILPEVVRLQMSNVFFCETRTGQVAVLNTGSPHYVLFTENDPEQEDLINMAREIRFGNEFQSEGINVNLVQITSTGQLKIRTYERGVEDETYSCGTGVTAAAIAYNHMFNPQCNAVQVSTAGGILSVEFTKIQNGWGDIYLSGPAQEVFTGIWP